ncbi:MAG: carboxylating nicotinate-nucleotide diphosphorylase [Parvularcula sp.]
MTQSPTFPLPRLLIEPLIARALEEDFGEAGDLTTLATIPTDRMAEATLNVRRPGTLAGTDMAIMAFQAVDPSIKIGARRDDGSQIAAGEPVLTVSGPARSLLSAERVALNFLGPMSGIATATRALVDAVAGTDAKIACTRKTLPGLRAVQKYAVKCGGGINHRFGLFDALMIKDNHIVAAGGIQKAVSKARDFVGHTAKIEVEVDTLEQLEEALGAGADIVLLDNMTLSALSEAVARGKGKAILEASGNVSLDTVRAIAQTGVDVISSGAITHSAPQVDIGMELSLN